MTAPPPVVPISRLPSLLASGGTAARVSWPPENRAANAVASSAASSASSAAPIALSGRMGLSPSPHPSPWDQRSTSPDQKSESRTLQGPSPKEWAAHRDTIIDLYRQFPLKKVSDLMRKHHNFSARYVLPIRIRHCAQPIPAMLLSDRTSQGPVPTSLSSPPLVPPSPSPPLPRLGQTCRVHLHLRLPFSSHHIFNLRGPCIPMIHPGPSYKCSVRNHVCPSP